MMENKNRPTDKKEKVFIIPCPDYEQVPEKTEQLFSMMGGISRFVKQGEKILIKPNLLATAKPEKAITTHPAVVGSVGSLIGKAGGKVMIAESPGTGMVHNRKNIEKCYEVCGITEYAVRQGWELVSDFGYREVSYKEGKFFKRFEIIDPVYNADAIFNVCKFKTHLFMHFTGAVKNLFGLIPGLFKAGYHSKLYDAKFFARMLLDLAGYIKPRLSVMDAVIGMEGNGPSGGTPKKVGFLIASENPLALDIVAGEIAGLAWKDHLILAEAHELGMLPYLFEHIELVGADRKEIKCRDFQLPSTVVGRSGLHLINRLAPLMKRFLSQKPVIMKDRCIACGACKKGCPKDAVSISEYAAIEYNKCIRCYCCHEMCPENAIDLSGGILYKLVSR